MKFLETEITSKEQVEEFFNKLNFHNILFHPEDDPKDVVDIRKETEITSKEQVEEFFNKLNFHNILFHPEDDPKDVVDIRNIKVFTDEQCKLLDKRLTECYEYHIDPCEYILENFY